MTRLIPLILALLSMMLSACATMNSNFSCNATAGDSCLTIEEVDAMTRFADEGRAGFPIDKKTQKSQKAHKNYPPRLPYITNKTSEPIWVSPWVDGSGKQHQGSLLYAKNTKSKEL
jgi:conjugal transfer pilus assembly protein TraV